MNTVSINKSVLLDEVKKNKEEHIKDYNAALEGYQKAVLAAYEKMGVKIASNDYDEEDLIINLRKPVDYSHEYDKVIKKLELSADNIITLDNRTFDRYVLNDWPEVQVTKSLMQTYSAHL